METFETALWASHLIIVIALVITILLQRSEGGALGIGGGGGDAMMSGRSAGNVLTKVTTVLAILFFLTSLSLAYISKMQNSSSSILTDASGEPTSAVPVSESEKAAAEKSLDNLLKQSNGSESSVPVSE